MQAPGVQEERNTAVRLRGRKERCALTLASAMTPPRALTTAISLGVEEGRVGAERGTSEPAMLVLPFTALHCSCSGGRGEVKLEEARAREACRRMGSVGMRKLVTRLLVVVEAGVEAAVVGVRVRTTVRPAPPLPLLLFKGVSGGA